MSDKDTFKVCAEEDAKDWSSSLDLTEEFDIEDAKTKAREYFENTFGKNGEFLPKGTLKHTSVEEILEIYESIFLKEVSHVLAQKRIEAEKEEEERKIKIEEMHLEGERRASIWYNSILGASWVKDIDEEEVIRIGNAIYAMLFPTVGDKVLKKHFVLSFTETSKRLFNL